MEKPVIGGVDFSYFCNLSYWHNFFKNIFPGAGCVHADAATNYSNCTNQGVYPCKPSTHKSSLLWLVQEQIYQGL